MKARQFQTAQGGRLTWFETGQGRPLVLLHGWAMSAAAFDELAGLLAMNFRVLAPDLPGHGESSPAVQNDLAGVSGLLTDWLAALEVGPCALVGWSLGGMLSLQIVSDGVLPVQRLVLMGSTPKFTIGEDWPYGLPATQVRAMARNLKRQFEPTLAEFFALTFAGVTISIGRLRAIRNFAVRASSLPDQNAAFALLNMLAEQDQRDIELGQVDPRQRDHAAPGQQARHQQSRPHMSMPMPHASSFSRRGSSSPPSGSHVSVTLAT